MSKVPSSDHVVEFARTAFKEGDKDQITISPSFQMTVFRMHKSSPSLVSLNRSRISVKSVQLVGRAVAPKEIFLVFWIYLEKVLCLPIRYEIIKMLNKIKNDELTNAHCSFRISLYHSCGFTPDSAGPVHS